MSGYFTESQITLAGRTFAQAEQIAGRYFRLRPQEWKTHRYDVKTLAYLDRHEVRQGAFAHLCKYGYGGGEGKKSEGSGRHFYRICLQDDSILDAVERASSFIRLAPLLLYIAAHELVHVIRFDRGVGDFDADEQQRLEEEQAVHRITRNVLMPATDSDMKLVLDCFSDRYQIGDFLH